MLLTGALLIDIGKVHEFEVNKARLVSEYTMEGDLIGHSVLGAFDVLKAAEKLDIPREKAMFVEHLILSHHGRPEHGAAVLPRCIEAEILSCLDMLDCREGIYEKVLDGVEAGIPIKAFALNNKRVFKHDPAA